MVSLSKHEPQELRLDDPEESKSSAEQWTGASMADEQPQSLILQVVHDSVHRSDVCESPPISEQSARLHRYPEFRALKS